jgi:GT2 family glycosyltransferase
VTADGIAAAVTVVTVSYNSGAVLPDMLSSIPQDVPVIVVDNASSDAATLDALCAANGATLIRNDRNHGFGVACNTGAALARTPFILFMNPDARLDPGALDAMLAAFRDHPEAVALNPAIRKPGGSVQFKRGSVLLPRSNWLPRGWPRALRPVPVLHGAVLMVRRAAFDAVGGFDPKIFLYHEDDDLSLRLARDGTLLFVPEAGASHAAGGSTVRSQETAALKAWHMGRSRVHAARKHNRPLAFSRALAQGVVQMLSPLNLVSSRKRAKALGFVRGVWSMRGGAM